MKGQVRGVIGLIIGVGAIALLATFIRINDRTSMLGLLQSALGAHSAYEQCIREFSTKSIDRFDINEAYINSDTQVDAIVAHTDGAECGSGGCVHELCIADQDTGYRHMSFGFAAQEVAVQETLTNDMHDLILNNSKDLRLQWDGHMYRPVE